MYEACEEIDEQKQGLGKNSEKAECKYLETKWRGKREGKICEGYNIKYSGQTSTRNSIGMKVNKGMKGRVV